MFFKTGKSPVISVSDKKEIKAQDTDDKKDCKDNKKVKQENK